MTTGCELKTSERLQGPLPAILDSSADAIICQSLDMLVTIWNPAAEAMFGYTAQEVLGRPLGIFMPLENEEEEKQILANILRSEHIEHFETICIRKNGALFPVSLSISPIKDCSGNVTGVSKIARDVTEQKRREAYRSMGRDILLVLNDQQDIKDAIKHIIGIVKSAIEVNAVGIRLQDKDDFPYFYQEGFPQDFLQKENSLLSRDRDGGICRDKNGNVCLECTCGLVITGKTDPANPLFTDGGSSWTNNSLSLLHVPPDQDPRNNPRNECIHQGFESVALIPIRAKGQIVGLLQLNDHRKNRFTLEGIKALEDIAENIGEAMLRKQAESELRKSNDLTLNLLQNTDQGIYGINMDGCCTFINRSALSMLGYEAVDCLNRNMHELIHHSHANETPYPVSDCPIFRARTSGQGCRVDNEVLWRSNGTFFFVEYSSHPIMKNGVTTGAVVTFSDISAKKQAEEEKRKLESQLHQAQKMESVGSLAGGVAHDFNNKLSVIMGHAQLALTQTIPVQVRDSLEEILKASEQSADLTRQLLAFARKQTIEPKVLDLNSTVVSMLKMLQRLIGEDIDLAWLPAGGLWQTKADPSQIDQILANLCVNARDAIKDIGKITIETGNRTFDEEYCALNPSFIQGDYVQIVVSDNGCGMDRETEARIFEPFFTTKVLGKGTGLGLSTVYGIVKQNGGFITIYSEPGHGTTFNVYLPRYTGKEKQTRIESTAKPLLRGQETILLVEDEPSILKMTAMLLKPQGYNILAAGSPVQAIEIAEQYDGEIHLLMTDVVMPEMNGRELAKVLQPLYPKLKYLYMSGYTANVIAHHGVLDKGIHFIQKPFSLQALSAKLRDLLDDNKGPLSELNTDITD